MAKADVTFFTLTSFLTGILAASTLSNLYLFSMLLLSGAWFFIVVSRAGRDPVKRRAVYLAVGAAICGMLYYRAFVALHARSISIEWDKVITVRVFAVGEPKPYGNASRFNAKLAQPYEGTVVIESSSPIAILYGDEVEMKGRASRPREEREDAVFSATQMNVVSHGHGSAVKRALFSIKRKFILHVNDAFPAREAALANGLTLGDRTGFDKALKQEMAASGTTHLVALSGYNIAIIIIFIQSLMAGRLPRRAVFVITVCIILFFVVMVGGEASIVRAAIMGSLMLLSREAGRFGNMRGAITVSACMMSLHDPRILVFDLGFQLSFVSLLGIVYCFPALANRWKALGAAPSSGSGFLHNLKEHFLIATAATLAVLPLTLIYFENTSLTGIIANVLIASAIPITMLLGSAAGVCGWIMPQMGTMVGWIGYPFLHYILLVIHAFATIRIPISNPGGGLITSLIYYAVLVWFVARWTPRKIFSRKQHVQT